MFNFLRPMSDLTVSDTNAFAIDDRRSQRTRSALREALVHLIIERGWDDVTVQDLCERADIGRSTFYKHYATKDALLVGTFDDLRRFLRAQPNEPLPTGRTARFRFALGLIRHADERRRVFHALLGRRSGYVVHQRFREMVIQLVGDELPQSQVSWLPQGAAQRWVAGAFVELLTWWVEQVPPQSPAELAHIFDELAAPVWDQLVANR